MTATSAVLHSTKNALGEVFNLVTDAYGTCVSCGGVTLGVITEAHGAFFARNLEIGAEQVFTRFRQAINWL
jgi:hypothetical protein